jgi:hypothetical protein
MADARSLINQDRKFDPQTESGQMSEMGGQNRKSSLRARVFRFAPDIEPCATWSSCPKSANKRLVHRSKISEMSTI